MPAILQAHLLELLLSYMFSTISMEEMGIIRDKLFLFCTPDKELELFMRVEQSRIHVSAYTGETPDVTIRGDLIALTSLCLGLEDSDTLFFSRRLLMTGDTSTGLLFKNLLANLDFDLRSELERRLGKTMADTLLRFANGGLRLVESVDSRLAGTVADLGERVGLSPSEKVQSLEQEVRKLREEQAVLKRRFERRPLRRVTS